MENNLQILIKESGLEETKANQLLTNFQDYFKIASEWELKAKTIVVNNETQEAEMQMARAGRLFLREKRIAIEKSRKELKEQSLREGKAIDGIANVLKGLIEPIEEYLDKQEHFVEIKRKEEEELKRIEEEKRIENERIAKEKAEREENERIRLENEKLKAEMEKQEKQRQEELKKIEEERKKENEARDKKLAEERKEAEKREQALKDAQKEEELARKKIEEELKNQIECPYCHKKFFLK
jgi:hypothetical protein